MNLNFSKCFKILKTLLQYDQDTRNIHNVLWFPALHAYYT
jgi:hypothetical protein